MTSRMERGSWLWARCYTCGHKFGYPATSCPQCGEEFDGRRRPNKWPDACECDRCRRVAKRTGSGS